MHPIVSPDQDGLHRETKFGSYGVSLVEFDRAAERRLRTKIDLMVIPTVSILYLFCFIDRANIGMDPYHHMYYVGAKKRRTEVADWGRTGMEALMKSNTT